jgi:hypothetical protein
LVLVQLGACFWLSDSAATAHFISNIGVSAKPAAGSLVTSFEILLLKADLRKVDQDETKDVSALIPQPEAK